MKWLLTILLVLQILLVAWLILTCPKRTKICPIIEESETPLSFRTPDDGLMESLQESTLLVTPLCWPVGDIIWSGVKESL